MLILDNIDIYIYVDRNSDTPWILRYESPISTTGFNEMRVASLEIRTPVKTVILDKPLNAGKYALLTKGVIESHPTEPRAIINALGMPKKWS